jgi:hypothetical protein
MEADEDLLKPGIAHVQSYQQSLGRFFKGAKFSADPTRFSLRNFGRSALGYGRLLPVGQGKQQ